MTYLVPLLLIAIAIGVLVWTRFEPCREPSTGPAADSGSTEQQLATRLVAGELSQADYQQAMADLAHHTDQPGTGVEAGVLPGGHGDPRARLAMLGVVLPELSPNVLCWAFVMAQNGADADTLVRSLKLTRWQAASVIACSRG